MVKTGARAAALSELLSRIGIRSTSSRPPAPRLDAFSVESAQVVLGLYSALGGTRAEPTLRPGVWDLACEGGLLIELDEELHFNRYRGLTLEEPRLRPLPWHTAYVELCRDREPDCLTAATWGKRWTNPSCERLFGQGDPPGVLGDAGAPRWKQRALYDAMKDVAAVDSGDVLLARLSTHDDVKGVTLGAILQGRVSPHLDAFDELLSRRTSS